MKKILAFILSFIMIFQVSITAFAFTDTTANIFTGKKYNHDDRFADCEIVNGLDISVHQGTISDFNKIKAAGVDYMFLRAAYRGYGKSGSLNKDTMFEGYIKGALAAGIDVGSYIYSQAITVDEAIAEADYILNIVKDYDITLPIVFDYEYISGGRLSNANLTNRQRTDICLAFCDRVEKAGYTACVYANHSMFKNDIYTEELADKYVLWLAQYHTKTELGGTLFQPDYSYWQYSSSGSVNGISGRVDCNFRYFKAPKKVEGLKILDETQDALTLSWEKVKDCYGYEIYKSDNLSGTYTKIGTNKGAGICTFTDTALNGASVSYKVKAISRNKGEFVGGEFSDEVELKGTAILTEPFEVTMQSNDTGYATFTWNEMSGATEYQVLRADFENAQYSVVKTLGSGITSYTDYTDNGFKTYYYMVRAVVRDDNGIIVEKVYSLSLKAEKEQPVMNSATLVENNAINVSWIARPYTTGTEIWRQIGDESFKRIATVREDVTSYIDSKLTRGVKYSYKVRQYIIKDGYTYYSDFSDIKFETTLKTTTITLSTKKSSATVTVSKVDGATGYEIYMKSPSAKKFKKIANTKKLKYKKTKLKKGKNYRFKVIVYRVVDGKTIYSPYSKTKKIKIK